MLLIVNINYPLRRFYARSKFNRRTNYRDAARSE